jgi:protein-tyrosine phosphatase
VEFVLPERCNFRDIGGLATRDGRTIAQGRLFRSADFSGVPAAVLCAAADGVGIRRVIDLRTDDEVEARGVVPVPDTCERHHLPFFSVIRPHWSNPRDRTPPSIARMYREMLADGFDPLVRIMTLVAADPPLPTLLHCVAGRDRTGIVVACLLDVLGVPDETIAQDYALSAVMDDSVGRHASPANILGLLELVRTDYGSTRALLREAGAGESVMAGLEAAFLGSPETSESGARRQ